MDRILERHDETLISGTYVYAKATSSDTYIYTDSACTKKIDTATLERLFLIGMVIMIDKKLHRPLSFAKSSAGVGFVTYITPNSTTATSADIGTLNAGE